MSTNSHRLVTVCDKCLRASCWHGRLTPQPRARVHPVRAVRNPDTRMPHNHIGE